MLILIKHVKYNAEIDIIADESKKKYLTSKYFSVYSLRNKDTLIMTVQPSKPGN